MNVMFGIEAGAMREADAEPVPGSRFEVKVVSLFTRVGSLRLTNPSL